MKNSKILVIDDEENMRKNLGQILGSKGYSVALAPSGAEGLKMFEKEPFDLVVTDVTMPELDGMAVLKKIKQANNKMPVIFITASDMNDVLKEAIQFGLDGFIEKPFNIESVFETVSEKLAKKK